MEYRKIGRNLAIYILGVALAVSGALGLVDAIELHLLLAAGSFIAGLALVIGVHEWLDGPF